MLPVAEATTAETKEIRGANEKVEADGRTDKCLQCHSVASVRHGGYSDRLLEYQYSAAVSGGEFLVPVTGTRKI
jgi:hypothetical protein